MNEAKRLIRALGFSIDGLRSAWRDEPAFRLEIMGSLVLIPLALILGDNGVERALLLGSWLIVPMMELINSGIEAITDYATENERHTLAKKAKDTGSAAVLVACVITISVWLAVLL